MDEKDWLILKVLYEKRSITQTAKTLVLSQPALSSRLQQIEARFGTPVVLRSKKGVHFTPQGEYLAKCAYEMLKKIQSIDENINNMCEQPAGLLRIGASTFFTKYLLPELLKRFKKQYPAVEFKVTTGYSRDIFRLLYENDIHIAFIRGEYNWPEKVLLFKENMYISSQTPLNLEDLPHMPQIDYPNDYSVKLDLNRWWHENYAVPPYIGMEVDKADTCQEMVSKGLGYGFLPGKLIEKTEGFYNYQISYRSGEPVTRKTWMFYTNEVMDLMIVKAFYNFVSNLDFATL